jgi:hypothetical protein
MRQPRQSPFCTNLRTKKYHFLERPPLTTDELCDASGHCWCAETQQSVGADGDIVGPEDCADRARSCFQPFPTT